MEFSVRYLTSQSWFPVATRKQTLSILRELALTVGYLLASATAAKQLLPSGLLSNVVS
jgi:hypothetical protein